MKRVVGSANDAVLSIAREVERTQLRARKGIKLIVGRPPPQVSQTPKDEVWSLGRATLWRYRNDNVRYQPPLLLFLGLVGDPAIFDLHPGNSWAERLVAEGYDVYLFDWGRPEAAEGDHTLGIYLNGYFVHALEAVRRTSGSTTVTLGAYCMGAFMSLLLLGTRDDLLVNGLVLFTPPCDYRYLPGFLNRYRERRMDPADAIDTMTGLVPQDAVRAMFRLLQPTSDVVQYVTLWENLWRDDYVEAHRAVNHWAWSHRAIAGPAFREMIEGFVQDNGFIEGTAQLDGHPVDLGSIKVPTLLVIAERDEFVPPRSSEPLTELLGAADIEVLRVPRGHAGALMGSGALKVTMPGVIDWLGRHSKRPRRAGARGAGAQPISRRGRTGGKTNKDVE